ncbi:5-formyltetrahydrofolate cyclo-ligase [Tetzosporium hominis]|uniref:5-formyltetrahydrofolate cyclo-ligase n=1 Tax=Tetzosporium hominis TaxID=2020506 RepID=A0A264W5F5_9BACL|nr:5-formyltetrahydrofolate cyclo-ligase [Tetzosporium hominis]OZS78826.1 5-formyltetrahydrofolate cyclo-ligase [Tetzosporium hominis]
MKRELRNAVLNQMNDLGEQEHRELSKQIVTNAVKFLDSHPFKTIAVTLSRFPEVDTSLLIKHFWQQEKTVCVPKSDGSTKQMQFYKINSWSDIEPGYKGILEPKVSSCESVAKSEIDCIIVPGVVFTFSGYRIGFGGGFYDRYLEDYSGVTCSLLASLQLEEQLPIEQHDVAVQYLITEQNIIKSGE